MKRENVTARGMKSCPGRVRQGLLNGVQEVRGVDARWRVDTMKVREFWTGIREVKG